MAKNKKDKVNETRCPVCGGWIIVTSSIQSRVHDACSRAIMLQDSKPSIDDIFCEDCFVRFNVEVLPGRDIEFIGKKPYWRSIW